MLTCLYVLLTHILYFHKFSNEQSRSNSSHHKTQLQDGEAWLSRQNNTRKPECNLQCKNKHIIYFPTILDVSNYVKTNIMVLLYFSLQQVMLGCWHSDPAKRPSFNSLQQDLDDFGPALVDSKYDYSPDQYMKSQGMTNQPPGGRRQAQRAEVTAGRRKKVQRRQ